MNAKVLGCAALLAVSAGAASPPLPVLRVEPTEGGSIFYIKNVAEQPLTGYLIELVNYPGSFYMLWQDELAAPVAPGAEKRMRVGNMIVGAVPDYVKLRAALYADGSAAGDPRRVAQFEARRKEELRITRELIRRLEKPGTAAEIKQWAETLPAPTRANRDTQEGINQAAAKELVSGTAAKLEKQTAADVLAGLRARERALAGSER